MPERDENGIGISGAYLQYRAALLQTQLNRLHDMLGAFNMLMIELDMELPPPVLAARTDIQRQIECVTVQIDVIRRLT